MITDEHLPALQGMFPSWITTVSSDGEPNTTVISQIWHVNDTEVALSFQFFNKTKKNNIKGLKTSNKHPLIIKLFSFD